MEPGLHRHPVLDPGGRAPTHDMPAFEDKRRPAGTGEFEATGEPGQPGAKPHGNGQADDVIDAEVVEDKK